MTLIERRLACLRHLDAGLPVHVGRRITQPHSATWVKLVVTVTERYEYHVQCPAKEVRLANVAERIQFTAQKKSREANLANVRRR